MADYPFVIPINLTVGAGTTNTAAFAISSNEVMHVYRIQANLTTALVNIVNIRDQGGRGYMPPGAAGNIPISMIGNNANANERGVLDFQIPLELPAQGSLLIDVSNGTGGSITITLVVIGVKSQLGS